MPSAWSLPETTLATLTEDPVLLPDHAAEPNVWPGLLAPSVALFRLPVVTGVASGGVLSRFVGRGKPHSPFPV